MKYKLILIALLLMPVGVLAQAVVPGDSGLQQTSTPSAPASSSQLQPSNAGSVQPATTGGASQSGDAQNLQQGGASDQQKLMVEDEGDAPHTGSDNHPWWMYAVIIGLALVAGTTGVILTRTMLYRRNTKPHQP